MGILLILLAILAALMLLGVAIHGGPITSRNGCRSALARIEAGLQRRSGPVVVPAAITSPAGGRVEMREAPKGRF